MELGSFWMPSVVMGNVPGQACELLSQFRLVIEQLGDFGQILLTPPLLPESSTQHLL